MEEKNQNNNENKNVVAQQKENVVVKEKDEIDKLKKENEDLKKQVADNKKRLKGADYIAKEAQKMLSETNEKLIKVNAELSIFKQGSANQNLINKIEKLEQDLKDKNQDIAVINRDKQKLMGSYNFLLGRKKLNETEIDRLQKENLELRQKNGEEEINNLKNKISDLEQQNQQLADKITPGYEIKDASTQYDECDINSFSLFNSENIIPLEENNNPAEFSGKNANKKMKLEKK
ncbi:MAG: hypothetical protein IJ590_02710 [Rickettsiales bacterium]|nr:hypothetical protein [Rickettsiales bacterium]